MIGRGEVASMPAINKLDINTDDLSKAIQKFNAIKPRGKNDFYECDFLLSRIMTPNAGATAYPMHRHSYYELHIPISGTAEYLVGDETVECTPQKALLLLPNQTHRYLRSQQYISLTLGFIFVSPASLATQATVSEKYIELDCSADIFKQEMLSAKGVDVMRINAPKNSSEFWTILKEQL